MGATDRSQTQGEEHMNTSSPEQISLMKTLCAMRWIMLMNGNYAVAKVIEANQETAEASNE
jgi:hypothetical protein